MVESFSWPVVQLCQPVILDRVGVYTYKLRHCFIWPCRLKEDILKKVVTVKKNSSPHFGKQLKSVYLKYLFKRQGIKEKRSWSFIGRGVGGGPHSSVVLMVLVLKNYCTAHRIAFTEYCDIVLRLRSVSWYLVYCGLSRAHKLGPSDWDFFVGLVAPFSH